MTECNICKHDSSKENRYPGRITVQCPRCNRTRLADDVMESNPITKMLAFIFSLATTGGLIYILSLLI